MSRQAWNWIQVLVVWVLLATALSLPSLMSGTVPTVTGDDAMRLVQAIDLYNGQDWFDTAQHRDNAPFGAPMHWSRLIDAPLALLMAVLSPFAQDAAPYWAAFVWPLMVLLAVVALVAELSERIGGRASRLPALGLLAMTLAVYTEFVPGRVDHHNVQIALTLGMVLATLLGRHHPGWAVAAGALAATGLAIGTEVLPSVAVVLVCFGLYWVVDPIQGRRPLLAVAAGFPAGLLVHLLISTRLSSVLQAACDALSASYVVAGILFSVAILVAVAAAPVLRGAWQRFGALGALAIMAMGLCLWLFPECMGGPYGNLDDDLASILMPEIGEAQPIWVWASGWRPQVSLLVVPIIGSLGIVLAAALAPRQTRWRWAVLGGFCFALFVVFCLQVRGFRLLSIALLPGPAYLGALAWEQLRQSKSLVSIGRVVLTFIAFAGAGHLVLFSLAHAAMGLSPPVPPTRAASWADCQARSAYEQLAALPRGNMMSFLLIGPQLLLETPHSVVSAGYHRNEDGLRDMVRFFEGGEAEALAVVRERGLDYLVFCRGIEPTTALAGLPDFEGLGWSWLTPLSDPEAGLQIYAIDLAQ